MTGKSYSESSSGNSSNPKPSSFSDKETGAWLSLSFTKSLPFACPRCSKTFPSPQALGGHQNAHRKECRVLLEECIAKNKDRDYKNSKHFRPVLCPTPLRVVLQPPSGAHGQVAYGSNPNPPVSSSGFQIPDSFHHSYIYHTLPKEYCAAFTRSVEGQEIRGHATTRARQGWLQDSSGATGWNPVSSTPSRREDCYEVTSGRDELDLTLRL